MIKKDSISLGIIVGLFTPLLNFALYKFIKFGNIPFKDIFSLMKENPDLISASLVISLVGNLVVFTLMLNKKIDRTAKGIFFVTCLYALTALVLKYML